MKDIPGWNEADLTPREREIMELYGQGYSQVEIAEKLFISYKTVEKHRSNVKVKLGIDAWGERSGSLLKVAIGWHVERVLAEMRIADWELRKAEYKIF